MLGYRIGRVSGNMDNMYFPECGPDVDIIVACRTQGYELDSGFVELINHFCIHIVVYEHADGFAVRGQRHGVLVQLGFQETELDVGKTPVMLKCRLVICLGVKQCNSYHIRTSSD